MKIKAVALDIMGNAKQWLDENGDESHMELCEILTIDDDSPIPISDLPKYDNWDILLVFEEGVRDQIIRLLDKLHIPEDKVLYPLDMMGSLVPNRDIASFILNERMGRLLEHLSHRARGDRYCMASVPGLSYINVSSDNVILPYMNMARKNWSADDMRVFYDLSRQYFDLKEEQTIFCDIGANIGTTCIYFKKELDPDVKILAFEPSCENYKLLCINAMLNDIDPAEHLFVKKGLSDVSTSGRLSYDPGNPGASSLSENKQGITEDIELVTFDGFLNDNSISPKQLRYLWIDVEGFEARFLAGARSALSQIDAPVFMEFIPRFYTGRENEFDMLIDELKTSFTSFICAQMPERGKIPVERLADERDNISLEWDLFLMKD